jgi:hypothetical protein
VLLSIVHHPFPCQLKSQHLLLLLRRKHLLSIVLQNLTLRLALHQVYHLPNHLRLAPRPLPTLPLRSLLVHCSIDEYFAEIGVEPNFDPPFPIEPHHLLPHSKIPYHFVQFLEPCQHRRKNIKIVWLLYLRNLPQSDRYTLSIHPSKLTAST